MIIGLDLSLNSSGVCVKKKNEDPIYYLVVPNMTKKQKAVQHKRVNYVVYDKEMKNISHNIRMIGNKIRKIITTYEKEIKYVVIEDVAMRARGQSVIDLTLLNGYIRCILDELNISYITVTPTQWKKKILGNGSADKELTIYHWARMDQSVCVRMMNNNVKCDDVADSYFLACC